MVILEQYGPVKIASTCFHRQQPAAAARKAGWDGRFADSPLEEARFEPIGPGLSLRFYSVQRRSIANSN